MKRPGYREAIEWIAGNDDCYWLSDKEPIISVTASMVRDLYDVTEEKLFSDIRRAMQRNYHPALEESNNAVS